MTSLSVESALDPRLQIGQTQTGCTPPIAADGVAALPLLRWSPFELNQPITHQNEHGVRNARTSGR